MKSKIFALVFALLLIFSGVLIADGGEASDGEDSIEPQAAQEINDWHDLNNTREDLGGDYFLMNDLNETTAGYHELVNTTDGWDPIGNDTNRFTGTFDGNGYEISKLHINRSKNNIGLFGYIGGGEVNDTGLVDVSVNGAWNVGALVGMNVGTVDNSYATGSMSGEGDVGGLVGDNDHGIIKNSYATGNGSGEDSIGGLVGENYFGTVKTSYANSNLNGNQSVGGLVGYNSRGTIENSYSVSNVSGEIDVGGLVGENEDAVSNSYATGAVSGNFGVGGLVGLNSGTISDSYAIGKVSGNISAGGLVGDNFDGTVSNSFWDIETSEMNTSDGGTGKNTTEMRDVGTYTDTATGGLDEAWDCVDDPNDDEGDEDTWYIDENGMINQGYPSLAWEYADVNLYELTLRTEGQGNIEPTDGNYTYKEGEVVSIEAAPSKSWEFIQWTGDVDGDDQVINVTMNANKNITAVFEVIEYNLTINVDGDGNTDPLEGNYTAVKGEIMTIEANPSEGWKFDGWTGDVTGTTSTINVTIKEDKSITAEFSELEPDIIVNNFTVEVKGFEATITADVKNVGNAAGSIKLRVAGDELENVTLEPGENKTVEHTYEFEDEGEHKVELGDESKTVTVEEEDDSGIDMPMIIGIIVILVIVLAGIVYMMKSGEESGTEMEEESGEKETEEELFEEESSEEDTEEE